MDRQDTTTALINELMVNLGLPLSIEATFELTSSLILAILESTLRTRLPISQSLREARTLSSRTQLMTEVLLYLQSSLVQQIIGLDDIEPEKLTLGEEAETEFFGRLLCWLGELKGYLPDGNISCPVWHPRVSQGALSGGAEALVSAEGALRPSSPTHSTFTAHNSTNSEIFASVSIPIAESDTTVLSVLPQTPLQRLPHLPEINLFEPPTRMSSIESISPTQSGSHTARCIHEIGEGAIETSPNHSVQDNQDESMTSSSKYYPFSIFAPILTVYSIYQDRRLDSTRGHPRRTALLRVIASTSEAGNTAPVAVLSANIAPFPDIVII